MLQDTQQLVVGSRIAEELRAVARERLVRPSRVPAPETTDVVRPRTEPEAAESEAIIDTHDLRRTFRARGGEVEAVRGVDLRVRAGQIFGFLGPNGAGKTTTLRMLATLLVPSAGEATVAGADLRREPATVRERIGYVPQGGSTDPAETGRRELVIQGRLYGMSGHEAADRAGEVLAALDLESAADRPTGTWSGGMRRRLDIGLGIVHRPRLLFLDEPTTGLDPQARARMWDEIRRLRASGTTVFLTTHYLEEADALADRLAIIDHGRIVADGTADELKRQVAGDVVTLGVDGTADAVLATVRGQPFVREASADDGVIRLYVDRGDAAVPSLLRLLDGVGLAPQTITLARPSLDDVFLRQTGRSLREDQPAA
ncbi:MAG TPA: ATP-binding cassette domain-containing protein [Candidatus Limnocylindrales bacterium]